MWKATIVVLLAYEVVGVRSYCYSSTDCPGISDSWDKSYCCSSRSCCTYSSYASDTSITYTSSALGIGIGAIVGIVIGVLVCIGGCITACVICCRGQNTRQPVTRTFVTTTATAGPPGQYPQQPYPQTGQAPYVAPQQNMQFQQQPYSQSGQAPNVAPQQNFQQQPTSNAGPVFPETETKQPPPYVNHAEPPPYPT